MPVILLYLAFGILLSSTAFAGHPIAGLAVWAAVIAVILCQHALRQQRKRPTQ